MHCREIAEMDEVSLVIVCLMYWVVLQPHPTQSRLTLKSSLIIKQLFKVKERKKLSFLLQCGFDLSTENCISAS